MVEYITVYDKQNQILLVIVIYEVWRGCKCLVTFVSTDQIRLLKHHLKLFIILLNISGKAIWASGQTPWEFLLVFGGCNFDQINLNYHNLVQNSNTSKLY